MPRQSDVTSTKSLVRQSALTLIFMTPVWCAAMCAAMQIPVLWYSVTVLAASSSHLRRAADEVHIATDIMDTCLLPPPPSTTTTPSLPHSGDKALNQKSRGTTKRPLH